MCLELVYSVAGEIGDYDLQNDRKSPSSSSFINWASFMGFYRVVLYILGFVQKKTLFLDFYLTPYPLLKLLTKIPFFGK